MPRIAEEIVRDAAAQRGGRWTLETVSEWTLVPRAVDAQHPDAVVLFDDAHTGTLRCALLEVQPALAILTLFADWRQSRVYRVETLGSLSADELLDTLERIVAEHRPATAPRAVP